MKTVSFEVYTLAELKELGDKRAVERAIDWLRDGAADYEWWDYVYDMWKDALNQIGFENADISFSGFSSQGDGASFTADVDLVKLATFMGTPVEPNECIIGDANGEDFKPFIVYKCHGVAFDKRFLRMKWLVNVAKLSVKRTSHHYAHSLTCCLETELDSGNHGHVQHDKEVDDTATGGYQWITSVPKVEALFDDFVVAVERLREDLCSAIYSSLSEEYDYLTSDEALEENAETNEYTFTAEGRREG